MAAPQALWPLPGLWAVLAGSRRGLSPDRHRQTTRVLAGPARAVVARGTALADDLRARSGRRRLAQHLQAEGGAGGRATARRLRPQAGGTGQRPTRRGPGTTESRHG